MNISYYLPQKTFQTAFTESMSTRCLPGLIENVLADRALEPFVYYVDEFYFQLAVDRDNHSSVVHFTFYLIADTRSLSRELL